LLVLGNISAAGYSSGIIMAADRLPQLAQVLKSLLNTSVLPNIAVNVERFSVTSVDRSRCACFWSDFSGDDDW